MTDDIKGLIEAGIVWSPASQLSGEPLSEEVLRYEGQREDGGEAPTLLFGIPEIDGELPWGGLPCGAVHEWELHTDLALLEGGCAPRLLLGFFVEQAFSLRGEEGFILWFGEECWPSPYLLGNGENAKRVERLLERSLFIGSLDQKVQEWALLKAMQSKSITAVIGFLRKRDFLFSKKLSLAAKRSGVLGLVISGEGGDQAIRTASTTRWCIEPQLGDPFYSDTSAKISANEISIEAVRFLPRFSLKLLHCKGRKLRKEQWVIEYNSGEGYEKTLSLCVFPEMVNRSRKTKVA